MHDEALNHFTSCLAVSSASAHTLHAIDLMEPNPLYYHVTCRNILTTFFRGVSPGTGVVLVTILTTFF
jgi:hypothetical protein